MARSRMLPYLGFLALVGVAGCGGGTAVEGANRLIPLSSATSATTQGATQGAQPSTAADAVSPRPTPTGPPPFAAKVQNVNRGMLKHSWRPGCPVPPERLRVIVMTHWGFDGKARTGRLVVHRSVTGEVVSVFRRLYDWRYPIRRMEPVDNYGGDDYRSIDADNTSAFNCRPATGSSSWSKHAYGTAIDLNPRENPWVNPDGSNEHDNADRFVRRPLNKPGVINPGDRVVKAFAREGWEWGGAWSGAKDYQHFAKAGG